MKRGHGEKFTRNKEKAVLALLTEPSIGKAAEKVGIAEVTLWRWMQREDFNERYRQAKREAFTQTIGRLQQASTMAVDTLCDVMGNKKASPLARVNAAKTVLEMAHNGIETEEVLERLEKVENNLKTDVM